MEYKDKHILSKGITNKNYDEYSFINQFLQEIQYKRIDIAAQYFHDISVVINGELKDVLKSKEDTERWLVSFSELFDDNLFENYEFSIMSTKELSDKLIFTQVKLVSVGKSEENKDRLEIIFSISSDEHGQPKFIVVAIDSL